MQVLLSIGRWLMKCVFGVGLLILHSDCWYYHMIGDHDAVYHTDIIPGVLRVGYSDMTVGWNKVK